MSAIPATGTSTAGRNWLERPVSPALQRALAGKLTWELSAYVTLTALAFVTRIWDLGGRALHHDESLHATYAWYLFSGQGYHYDPVTHGPLQFYVMAFFYAIFGDAEWTARLFAALCGTGLVVLPYFLRRELGRAGALVAATALTISPTFMYFSRFARDDVLLEFFTLLMIVGIAAYARTQRRQYVYLTSVSAALAMATMEASYIFFFILITFLTLSVIRELVTEGPDRRVVSKCLMSVPLRVWLIAIGMFVGCTVLLYSTFLSNPTGIWDGTHSLTSPNRLDILGGITYWLSQHGTARGGQPWFYYFLILPLYEQFGLVFGAMGVIWAFIHRRLFITFLAYWFILSLAIYSWAGEKMPWLTVHPLLPALLLAGALCGQWLESFRGLARAILVGVLAVLVLTEAHSAQALSFADGANPTEMLVYVQTSDDVPTVANEVMALIRNLPTNTAKPYVQIDDSDLDGWPFEWYFRNLPPGEISYSHDFGQARAPVLIMLGPESDTYNAQLRARYDQSQYRWNWWFPEDYKGFTFDHGMCGTAYAEVKCALGQTGMTFLKTGTPCAQSATNLTNCAAIQSPTSIDLLDSIRSFSTYKNLWNWFVFRTPFGARGARMMDVYVRKDILPKGSGTFQSTVASGSNETAFRSLSFSTPRNIGASVVNGPEGGSVGPDGDIYVADSGNHRIDVFGSRGRLSRRIGYQGSGDGQFNANASPMDVAVGRNGMIYAADFWGDRIEEFTSNGSFVRTWGHPGKPGPYGLYGPRSLAIATDGDIYVADTGDERVVVYSPTGRYLFSFGSNGSGSGQFFEPSSVFIGRRGGVYVNDMWNGRIQRFTPDGRYISSWNVPWTAHSYAEPYGTQLSNGNFVVSDPDHGRLIVYSPTGKVVGQITGPQLVSPSGIFTGPAGRIFVSDSSTNSIHILKLVAASAKHAK